MRTATMTHRYLGILDVGHGNCAVIAPEMREW